MDQKILVSAGHLIIKELGTAGINPRAAIWVHATDTDTWKLLVVPPKKKPPLDQREFYRKLATIVAKHRPELGGVDAADVEMITDQHPLIKGLRGAYNVTGGGTISIQSSVINGYYLAEAILLRMDV